MKKMRIQGKLYRSDWVTYDHDRNDKIFWINYGKRGSATESLGGMSYDHTIKTQGWLFFLLLWLFA